MINDNFELDGYRVPVLIIHNGRLVPTGDTVTNMSEARDLVPKAIREAERQHTRYPSIKNVWNTFWVPVVMDQQFVVGFRNKCGTITIQVWEVQCYGVIMDSQRKDAQPMVLIYEEVQQHTKPVFTRYQNNMFQSAWSLTAPNVWMLSSLSNIFARSRKRNAHFFIL